jgi:hypothetical protein
MSTSGAELATAWGTIGAAGAAAAGLFVALRINSKDRKAAAELAEADRTALRDDERRRQIVANLLELGRQYGIMIASTNTPDAGPATQRVRLLLHAIPGECAYAIKHMLGFTVPDGYNVVVVPKIRRLRLMVPPPSGQQVDADEVYREIADDIDRYSQQPAETGAD